MPCAQRCLAEVLAARSADAIWRKGAAGSMCGDRLKAADEMPQRFQGFTKDFDNPSKPLSGLKASLDEGPNEHLRAIFMR